MTELRIMLTSHRSERVPKDRLRELELLGNAIQFHLRSLSQILHNYIRSGDFSQLEHFAFSYGQALSVAGVTVEELPEQLELLARKAALHPPEVGQTLRGKALEGYNNTPDTLTSVVCAARANVFLEADQARKRTNEIMLDFSENGPFGAALWLPPGTGTGKTYSTADVVTNEHRNGRSISVFAGRTLDHTAAALASFEERGIHTIFNPAPAGLDIDKTPACINVGVDEHGYPTTLAGLYGKRGGYDGLRHVVCKPTPNKKKNQTEDDVPPCPFYDECPVFRVDRDEATILDRASVIGVTHARLSRPRHFLIKHEIDTLIIDEEYNGLIIGFDRDTDTWGNLTKQFSMVYEHSVDKFRSAGFKLPVGGSTWISRDMLDKEDFKETSWVDKDGVTHFDPQCLARANVRFANYIPDHYREMEKCVPEILSDIIGRDTRHYRLDPEYTVESSQRKRNCLRMVENIVQFFAGEERECAGVRLVRYEEERLGLYLVGLAGIHKTWLAPKTRVYILSTTAGSTNLIEPQLFHRVQEEQGRRVTPAPAVHLKLHPNKRVTIVYDAPTASSKLTLKQEGTLTENKRNNRIMRQICTNLVQRARTSLLVCRKENVDLAQNIARTKVRGDGHVEVLTYGRHEGSNAFGHFDQAIAIGTSLPNLNTIIEQGAAISGVVPQAISKSWYQRAYHSKGVNGLIPLLEHENDIVNELLFKAHTSPLIQGAVGRLFRIDDDRPQHAYIFAPMLPEFFCNATAISMAQLMADLGIDTNQQAETLHDLGLFADYRWIVTRQPGGVEYYERNSRVPSEMAARKDMSRYQQTLPNGHYAMGWPHVKVRTFDCGKKAYKIQYDPAKIANIRDFIECLERLYCDRIGVEYVAPSTE